MSISWAMLGQLGSAGGDAQAKTWGHGRMLSSFLDLNEVCGKEEKRVFCQISIEGLSVGSDLSAASIGQFNSVGRAWRHKTTGQAALCVANPGAMFLIRSCSTGLEHTCWISLPWAMRWAVCGA